MNYPASQGPDLCFTSITLAAVSQNGLQGARVEGSLYDDHTPILPDVWTPRVRKHRGAWEPGSSSPPAQHNHLGALLAKFQGSTATTTGQENQNLIDGGQANGIFYKVPWDLVYAFRTETHCVWVGKLGRAQALTAAPDTVPGSDILLL